MAIRVEKADAVTTVIMDRPARRNAVDAEHARGLAEAFRAFAADQAARVAVLWGAHGVFCAGADLKAFAEGAGVKVRPDGDGPMGPTRMLMDKPVIAAISGHAVAGGLELAIWCDLRVAEETAVFGVFNRRWGVPLLDGGTIRLARLIGMSRALDLILTGRAVDAAEAERIGLANRVVPPGRARSEAEGLARLIAGFPPLGVRSDRRSVYETEGLAIAEALRREYELGIVTRDSGESRAGAERFAAGAGRHGASAPIDP